MRAREFLSEESLNLNTFMARNPNYWRNLINRIKVNEPITMRIGTGANSLVDVQLPVKIAAQLEKIWNPSGLDSNDVASTEQIMLMKRTVLTATNGEIYRLNQVEKTKDIKQKIGKDGEETNSKWWNKGNVAEGIMSCAVITKFENGDKEVDGAAVFYTAQKLQNGGYSTVAFGKELLLKITLSSNDYKALLMSAQNPTEFRKFEKSDEIYKLYENCATYVNDSNNVKEAMEKIKMAARGDKIEVTADGATPEAQSSTKADLWIAVGGKKERLLSIKTATVKHIGAVSGYESHHISTYFKSTVGIELPEEITKLYKSPPASKFLPGEDGKLDKTQANPNYVPLSKADRTAAVKYTMNYNYSGPTKQAYTYIYNEINKRLSGDSPDKEYNFIKTVTDGVVHHATLGEDVRIVIISPSAKKAYTELKFGPELYNALESYDLVPVLNLVGANYKLLVYGYPKDKTAQRVNNDKSLFVQMRSYIQDGAARNVVEIGGLLKDLTNVEKLNQEEPASPVVPSSPAVPAVPQGITSNTPVVPVPAGIQNQTKQIGNKIPMGSAPDPAMPQ